MIRADFNFSDESNNVSRMAGYVLGQEMAVFNGDKIVAFNFRPLKVVIQKLFTKKGLPDFKLLERLAIENCNICVK